MQIIIALAIKTCNTGQGSFSEVGLQGVWCTSKTIQMNSYM